ncbi:MAG: hypothetical protein K2L12_06815 [Clostridia bacterium]|nr:hypothetical protein [Clostridia bacterium]
MTLLAGISFGEKLTVIILCICILVFMLVNVYLVISLHLRNKKIYNEEEKKSSTDIDDDFLSQ